MTEATIAETTEARIERHVRETPFVNLNDCTTSVPNEQGWAVHFDEEHHDKLREGGTTAVVHCLPSEVREDFRGGMKKLGLFHKQVEQFPGRYHLVQNADDLLDGPQGSIGVVLGFLNATMIEDDLDNVALFHRLGIRTMHLSYNRGNLVGSGISEVRDGGLTIFGRRVVQEMNRLRILIDLTHTGARTALDTIELTDSPVVYTHTACKALNDHIRCVSDEQIEAVASVGGYIGIISGKFLRADIAEVGSTVEDYLDHADHVIKVAGEDHVAVGLDVGDRMTGDEWRALDIHYPELFSGATSEFERVFSTAELWDFRQQKREMVKAMIARGYDDRKIEKMLGGNALRVFRALWE